MTTDLPSPLLLDEAETSVQRCVAEVVERRSGHPAVADAERSLSYGDLAAAAGGVARALGGSAAAERVAVVASRGRTATVALVGVLHAGACIVNVDPHLPAERRARLAALGRPVGVVAERAHLAAVRETFPSLPVVVVEDHLDTGGGAAPVPVDVPPDAPMWLGSTSGTTGIPKGVVHLHLTDLHMCRCQPALALSEQDRFGMTFGGAFTGLVGYPFWALLHGATLCPFDLRDRPLRDFGAWLGSEGVTVLHTVPTILRDALRSLPDGHVAPRLRLVYLGGEALSWDDVALVRSRLGPQVTVVNSSGTTEVGPYSCFVVPPEEPLGSGALPIGWPLPATVIELVDEAGRPVVHGATGRMVVRSRYVAGGYVGAGPDTDGVFATSATDARVREVRLADLARRDEEGRLWHAGRADATVKVRGNRVDLDGLAQHLRELPGVADAAASTREDGGVTAFLVTTGTVAFDVASLRSALADRVATHELPSTFVVVEELPRLPSGKVDRAALAGGGVELRPASPDPALGGGHPEVRAVCALWEEVLGLPVTSGDDWFALGGTSLQAVEVVLEVARRWDVELPAGVFLVAPTPAALVERIRVAGEERFPVLVPIRPTGSRPPLFVIHPLFGEVLLFHDLASHLDPDQPVFGLRSEALSGRRARWCTVEALAAAYAGEIRSRFPTGPYQLFGQSFGGTVAYELARQLVAEGHEVSLVALGDTSNPARDDGPAWLPAFLRTGRLLRLDRIAAGAAATEVARGALGRLVWALREQVRIVRSRLHLRTEGRVPMDLRGSYARWVNLRASRRYRPAPSPAPLLLLRSRDPDRDPTRGWGGLVPSVEVVTIDAFHGDIVREPAVGRTATVIAQRLVGEDP